MKIAVFGLGYVGCVSGGCMAELGHEVIGVDTNPVKVGMINEGRSPVIEKDLDRILRNVVQQKRFYATSDWKEAVLESEVALICVGTPSNSNGSIELAFIKRVSEQIGRALGRKNGYFVVVLRSTVLPGTVEEIVIPVLEKSSGKLVGQDFGVCMVPEFLREGSSVHDFYHTPRSVIGQYDKRSGDVAIELLKGIQAPSIRTRIKVAEMVKYADNSFHGLKVAFANEIGSICKELGINSHKVMEIFCKDDKLNLSPYYLKPGFAFGGSCLPKDLRAITYRSRMIDVATPVLDAILESNSKHIHRVANKLLEYKGCSLGFLGLSFKSGTDDLRESPLVEVIETMIGKGFSVRVYDRNVSMAKLIGANKEYIEKEIPHISSLMCLSAEELIDSSEVIIVGHSLSEFRQALIGGVREDQVVIDLVRILNNSEKIRGQYFGLCW